MRGPVLSRSYMPPTGECTGRDYPIIIGWDVQDVQGEVWLARLPSWGDRVFEIAFFTCNIEDDIAIPRENMEYTKWQKGAYLNVGMGVNDSSWRKWSSFTRILTVAEFMHFWKELGGKSVAELHGHKKNIEVYSEKHVNSRTAYLTDVQFVDTSSVQIAVSFYDLMQKRMDLPSFGNGQ